MARALSHDTRLLILDEPSAVLDQGEVENLFRVIRGLTAEGVAVVYISHRLEEIREIGDRITVLKDGRTVATGLAGRGHPDLRADQADDRPLHRVRLPAAPRAAARPRRRGPRGAGPRPRRGLHRRRPHRARRRDRRPGRAGRRRPLGDPRDRLRRPPGHRGHRHRRRQAAAPRLGRRRPCGPGSGLAPEERKSQGLLLDQSVYRNITVSSLAAFSPLRLPRPAARSARGRAS